ncbi:MAG: POTRA domain-containing protein, partial [Pseudomonadota bacterium]
MSSVTGAAQNLVRVWLIATLAFVVAMAISAGSSAAQSFRFTQFEIEGNVRVDDLSVLEIAGLSPGAAITAAGLNDATQNLRNSGLFETVTVTPQGGTLGITVIEFPTINRIAFEGNRRLDDAELSVAIRSAPRRIYSPETAEADAAAIVTAYQQASRLAATVTPSIIRRSDNRVDLVFEITEGRVVENERISFVGNREFSDRRLRRVIQTKQANRLRQLIRVDTFIQERIPLDRQLLIDFYNSRGYIDFRVLDVTTEFSRERNASFITFNIREGQSFDIGAVTVASAITGIDAASFENQVRVRTGQTFSPVAIDATVTRL